MSCFCVYFGDDVQLLYVCKNSFMYIYCMYNINVCVLANVHFQSSPSPSPPPILSCYMISDSLLFLYPLSFSCSPLYLILFSPTETINQFPSLPFFFPTLYSPYFHLPFMYNFLPPYPFRSLSVRRQILHQFFWTLVCCVIKTVGTTKNRTIYHRKKSARI